MDPRGQTRLQGVKHNQADYVQLQHGTTPRRRADHRHVDTATHRRDDHLDTPMTTTRPYYKTTHRRYGTRHTPTAATAVTAMRPCRPRRALDTTTQRWLVLHDGDDTNDTNDTTTQRHNDDSHPLRRQRQRHCDSTIATTTLSFDVDTREHACQSRPPTSKVGASFCRCRRSVVGRRSSIVGRSSSLTVSD